MDKNQKRALDIFHRAAAEVPAYGKFLKENRVKPEEIKSWEDFTDKVPITNKKNYLRKYRYPDLFPRGKMLPMVSMSSGSSGKPFYWPRDFKLNEEGGKIHEKILWDIFKIGTKRALAIVCFSMGTWIAGTYTTDSLKYIARKGYDLTVTTPGIEQEDILSILRDIGPYFEAVILAGYPPFLMDVLVEAEKRKINTKRLNIKLLMAGENFSEKWRSIIHKTGSIKSPAYGSVSIYGSADAAVLGHENPFSVFVRQKAEKDKEFARAVWGELSYTPTLVAYHPGEKYFESQNENLIFTADTGIPLVRYAIGDRGKILDPKKIMSSIKSCGYAGELKRTIKEKWSEPLLMLAGRKDVSTTFYALNIYPENIKAGLEEKRMQKLATGKFVTGTEISPDGKHQILDIKVELKEGAKADTHSKKLAQKAIFENLVKLNIEYRKLVSSIGKERSMPRIALYPKGHALFAIRRSKHKWTKT